jgi:perosamine synthetase
VVCADELTAGRVRLLRNQGMERPYHNEVIGYNARMSDLHAAIGRVQLERLADWTTSRRSNASYLTDALAALAGVVVPAVASQAAPVWHQYTIRLTQRDAVADAIASAGVGSGVYYPTPVHELPSYDLSLDLPRTREACAEVLSLPVHPALSERDLAYVGEVVAKVVAS